MAQGQPPHPLNAAMPIDEARLDVLPVPAAIARLTRGFIATGSKCIALAYLWPEPVGAADRQISEPLLRLLRRGVTDRTPPQRPPHETLLGIYSLIVPRRVLRQRPPPAARSQCPRRKMQPSDVHPSSATVSTHVAKVRRASVNNTDLSLSANVKR
jgi:hypothetical protein